jgi:hypothetical protein
VRGLAAWAVAGLAHRRASSLRAGRVAVLGQMVAASSFQFLNAFLN